MDFFGLSRLFNHQNELPAFQSFHRDFAWVCTNCHFVVEGAYRGTCRRCHSTHILNIQVIMDQIQSAAHDRLQEGRKRKGWVKAINGGVPKPLPKRAVIGGGDAA